MGEAGPAWRCLWECLTIIIIQLTILKRADSFTDVLRNIKRSGALHTGPRGKAYQFNGVCQKATDPLELVQSQ